MNHRQFDLFARLSAFLAWMYERKVAVPRTLPERDALVREYVEHVLERKRA